MYEKVLVPLDGSELAECVLPHVEVIANGCQIVDIVFVRVLEPFQMPHSVPGRGEFAFSEKDLKRMMEHRKAATEEYLNDLLNKLKYDGATLHSELLYGQAAESIAEYSEKNDIDLIIIATHGRSGVKGRPHLHYGTPTLSPLPARIPAGSSRGGEKYWVYGWTLSINRRTAEEYRPFFRIQRPTKSLYPSRSCDHRILPSRSLHCTFGE